MADPQLTPEPPTDNVVGLGASLTALASSSDDRDCLEVFANALDVGIEAMGPLLLTVLVTPEAGARILMIGHPCPGLTLQVDADLQISPIQLWFNENEGDDEVYSAEA